MNRRGDLIARLAKLDPEAAKLVANDKFVSQHAFNKEVRGQNGQVSSMFTFANTPQGHAYWYNLSKLLGEWGEVVD